jgi:hypothetical protein
VLVFINVHDIIVISSSDHSNSDFNEKFAIEDLGDLFFFFGIELTFFRWVDFNSRKYGVDLLSKGAMQNYNSSPTPLFIIEELSLTNNRSIVSALPFDLDTTQPILFCEQGMSVSSCTYHNYWTMAK